MVSRAASLAPDQMATFVVELDKSTLDEGFVEQDLRAALGFILMTYAADDSFRIAVPGGVVSGTWLDVEERKLLEPIADSAEEEAEMPKVRLSFVKEGEDDQDEKERTPDGGVRLLAVLRSSDFQLNLHLSYPSRLYTPTSATLFLEHLSTALSSVQSRRPLSTISLVSPSEAHQLHKLSTSGAPSSNPYSECSSLRDILIRAAQNTPNAIAFHFSTSNSAELNLTFSQLFHLSSILAKQIPSPLPDARIIPLCVPKSPLQIISLLAIVLSGNAYLNLEPSMPETRKEGILRDLKKDGVELWSGFAIVDGDEVEVWKKLKEGDASLIPEILDPREILAAKLLELEQGGKAEEVDWKLVDSFFKPMGNDACYVITTSGSTGTPKSILVEQQNIVAFLTNYRGVFGRQEGERVLGFPSYGFDVMVVNIWDTLAHSATFCLTTQEELYGNLASTIIRQGITIVDLTPSISSILFDHSIEPSETTRQAWKRNGFNIWRVNTGGEKVEGWVRDKWNERGVEVVVDYGPSESTVGIIANRRATRTPLPIGLPQGANRVLLLSPSSTTPTLVPLGAVGEICAFGAQISRGYLRKELNEGVFFEWQGEKGYRTGDLGRWSDVGEEGVWEIMFEGRRDGLVKINGLRIEIGEIESHLDHKAHPDLKRGVVDRLEKKGLAPRLVAFVSLSSSYSSSSSDFNTIVDSIKSYLREKIPSYMIPSYWIPVDEIPVMGMGKTDRKSLRSVAQTWDLRKSSAPNGKSEDEVVEDDDEVTEVVRKAWAKVLKLDVGEIKRESEFTMLGGDSVGFLKVVGVVAKGLERSIGWKDVVDAPNFGEFVKAVRKTRTSDSKDYEPYRPISLLGYGSSVEEVRAKVVNLLEVSPEDVVDIYPTAPSQDSILAASIDSSHYYAQASYSLQSDVSEDLLQEALVHLVERNELLRTIFLLVEGERRTLQAVLSPASTMVQQSSKLEKHEGGIVEIDRWLDEDRSDHSFAWGRLALRFALFTSPDGTRTLIWGMHHAMSDGWTLELLIAELRALCYNLPLPTRPPFASIVSSWLQRPGLSEDTRNFWSSSLSSAPRLDWPTISSLKGDMLCTSAAASTQCRGDFGALAREHGITPAIASRVAIFVAIACHSGSADVTAGIVRSGRDIDVDGGAENIVGPCVSVLPSHLQLHPSSSLLSLAKAEFNTDKKARLYQQITLAELSRLGLEGSRFRILITYQSLADREDDGDAPWPIHQPPQRISMPSNYALSFEITPELEDPDSFEFSCFYDERIISAKDVEAVLSTAVEVMGLLATNPSIHLDAIGLTAVPTSKKSVPMSKGNGNPSTNGHPPATETMKSLQAAWAQVLGLSVEEVSLDDTFGSLGGDSISMMRLSVSLKRIGLLIPVCMLEQLATIRSQGEWLDEKRE